ncbi:MAG TPA: DUF3857 domain-containing protein, partial [Sphingomicrobium sp.]
MIRRAALFWSATALSTGAWAGDKPLYAPAPAWVIPAPDPGTIKTGNDAPILLIMDQQQRLEEGRVWAYVDAATRIASAEVLDEAGTLSVSWQPADGDLIVHRVEILRGSERIDALAGTDRFAVIRREEGLEKHALDGVLTATMTVDGLRVGDVLRVTASTTRKDRALNGEIQTIAGLITEPAKVGFGRLRMSWPKGAPIRWNAYGTDATTKSVVRGGYEEIEIALPLAKPPELPDDAPQRFHRLPIAEATTFSGWPAVSKVMAPLYRTSGLIAAGSPLAAEVAKIAAKTTDPRTRAALALQLVQDEVRYLFKGMDGGNYIPQSPAQTWSARYGDCKAKSLMLLAILRELGIEAEVVLASVTAGDMVPKRAAMPGAFDHVIVRATIGSETLWLDGTTRGTRAGGLSDPPSFRNVLPVREAGAELLAVPLRAGSIIDPDVTLEIDQTGGLTLPSPYRATVVMQGALAGTLPLMWSQADSKQRDGFAQTVAQTFMDPGFVVERELTYDAASGTATLIMSGIASSAWRYKDGRIRAVLDRTISNFEFNPDRTRATWQDIPVSTGTARHQAIRTVIRLPGDGAGFALEGDTILSEMLAGTIVRRTSSLVGNILTVRDEMRADGIEIARADISAVRARVALAKTKLLTGLAPTIYPARWQVVMAARGDKRLDRVRAIYAKAIAKEPKEVLPYQNRADFLIGIFEWRAALADLDRVVAIEPSPKAHLARANLWYLLGDDKKSLEEIQVARKLDPGDKNALYRLADLSSKMGDQDQALKLLDNEIA